MDDIGAGTKISAGDNTFREAAPGSNSLTWVLRPQTREDN